MDDGGQSVSIIGLGAMGAELARALVAAGHRVTVWNRTASKAVPLVGSGAVLADSPAAAIAASPITLVCLWDYDAMDQILEDAGVQGALRGRVLVQLTTGGPDDALRQGAIVEKHGASFVAGGIMCYPRAVGADDTVFIYSGDRSVFERHADLLQVLAPAQRLVGAGKADVAIVYTAVWGMYFSAMGGLFEGLALIEAAGLSSASLQHLVRPMADKIVEGAFDACERLAAKNFGGDQATVAGHIDGLESTCSQIRAQGIEPRMLTAFVDQLRIAAVAGRGDDDVSAVADVLMQVGS